MPYAFLTFSFLKHKSKPELTQTLHKADMLWSSVNLSGWEGGRAD